MGQRKTRRKEKEKEKNVKKKKEKMIRKKIEKEKEHEINIASPETVECLHSIAESPLGTAECPGGRSRRWWIGF
jgi:hypothetical protein